MFAPNENPMPNNGRFGNVFRSHFTTWRTSHVARALNSKGVLIFICAHPRPFTTHASHPLVSSSTSGARAALRYTSCDPPVNPCSATSMGLESFDGSAASSSFEKKVVRAGSPEGRVYFLASSVASGSVVLGYGGTTKSTANWPAREGISCSKIFRL